MEIIKALAEKLILHAGGKPACLVLLGEGEVFLRAEAVGILPIVAKEEATDTVGCLPILKRRRGGKTDGIDRKVMRRDMVAVDAVLPMRDKRIGGIH